MKKLLSVALVMFMLTSLFAGCASSASPASSSAPAAAGSEAPASEEPQLSLKLAENQPQGNPITEGMVKFAELVEQKTNGSIKIEVYSDAQLGQETETIEQIQAGTLDFARVNTSALASTAPEVEVYTLPYIFANSAHKYKVLDGDIGKATMDSLPAYNMVGLEYWEAGSRNFYVTGNPIKSLADLKGKKIRVQQSEVAIHMVELLGAVPTPMAYGEVFQGLQTGVIDGAENDFVSYYTSGHYEVAKNISLDGHMAPPAILLCSQSTWDKMSDTQKVAVTEAAKEAAVWQRKAMDDFQMESRAAVEAAGCQVYDVDVTEFQAAVSQIYTEYPQFTETIASIQALQ